MLIKFKTAIALDFVKPRSPLVPALPGCATQGNTFEELLQNLYEAVEGCLLVDTEQLQLDESS